MYLYCIVCTWAAWVDSSLVYLIAIILIVLYSSYRMHHNDINCQCISSCTWSWHFHDIATSNYCFEFPQDKQDHTSMENADDPECPHVNFYVIMMMAALSGSSPVDDTLIMIQMYIGSFYNIDWSATYYYVKGQKYLKVSFLVLLCIRIMVDN